MLRIDSVGEQQRHSLQGPYKFLHGQRNSVQEPLFSCFSVLTTPFCSKQLDLAVATPLCVRPYPAGLHGFFLLGKVALAQGDFT